MDPRRRMTIGATKLVGLTIKGEREPEVFEVCTDVFQIVEKMMNSNRRLWRHGAERMFEFGEVRFLLRLLGIERPVHGRGTLQKLHLWIAEH